MQAFAIGKDTLLRGEYRLLEKIGGTESRVYLATRETNAAAASSGGGSPVVVARLWQPSDELLHEHGAQALFERAIAHMRSSALLRHPILAMVETCGVLDEGTLYLISEHYEGVSLETWIDSAGIPPLPSVIDLAYRVCSGLNAAHRNGLSHAALHPRSIIVRPQTETSAVARLHAKLIDFGAPTCMFPSPPSLHAARFMAPEQLELALRPTLERAEPTVRMNVYGCGALLYYLCTGGPPLPGQSVDELMVGHAAHKVLPPSRINPQVIPALDAIILKALEAQPRARYANAAELANALISIRFERSSSGVRHRAVSDRQIELLEERPTSRTQKPTKNEREDADTLDAFPLEKPTAVVRTEAVTPLPPLPPLTVPPPSMPPVPVEPASFVEIQAPELRKVPQRLAPQPPPVRARPARRSLVPRNELFGHVPPWAFIALAAVISISVIYAVISNGGHDEATPIEVTPLPAPMMTTPAHSAPAPMPSANNAGASAAVQNPEPVRHAEAPREPRTRRSTRTETRVMPAPDDPIVDASPAPRAQAEPARAEPKPEPEPIAEAPREKEVTELPATTSTTSSTSPAISPSKSTLAPLPKTQVKPLTPVPAKVAPRFYDLQVKGSLATSQVKRGIERIQGAVRDCYRVALSSQPTAPGELSVEVVVDERGRARSSRASGAAPSALQRCIENAARRINVAPPDTGTVTATWKVSL